MKPKQLSKKKLILYAYSFENYISFLQEFDFDEVDKFDLHTNKNVKYIFYRYNSYLELTHQTKQIIRHAKNVKNKVGLKKTQNKDWQNLVEKIIGHIESKKKQTQLNKN